MKNLNFFYSNTNLDYVGIGSLDQSLTAKLKDTKMENQHNKIYRAYRFTYLILSNILEYKLKTVFFFG